MYLGIDGGSEILKIRLNYQLEPVINPGKLGVATPQILGWGLWGDRGSP